MSAVTTEPTVSAATRVKAPRPGWLVGPWFDALFIANLGWPLLVLLQTGDGFGGRAGLQFWQIYYVTTPHRWATLLLVLLDRDRFAQRRGAFLAIAAAVVVVCLGVRLTTGALTCLMAVDYVWNAWHFASQHHGIYRIYARSGGPGAAAGLTLEKWAMRGFLLYVSLRVATVTRPEAGWHAALGVCDWCAWLVPVWLVLRALGRLRSPGGVTYLVSVACLYSGLLWAVHQRWLGAVLALATASALFHATEYLALVSWSVRQRHAALGDRMGLLGYLAPRWGLTLAVFILILGSAGWLMDQRYLELWLLVNIIVAFLHYSYDGLIWRRSPQPAAG